MLLALALGGCVVKRRGEGGHGWKHWRTNGQRLCFPMLPPPPLSCPALPCPVQPMEEVWKRLGVPPPAVREQRGATPLPDMWAVPMVLAVPDCLHSIKDHGVPSW